MFSLPNCHGVSLLQPETSGHHLMTLAQWPDLSQPPMRRSGLTFLIKTNHLSSHVTNIYHTCALFQALGYTKLMWVLSPPPERLPAALQPVLPPILSVLPTEEPTGTGLSREHVHTEQLCPTSLLCLPPNFNYPNAFC